METNPIKWQDAEKEKPSDRNKTYCVDCLIRYLVGKKVKHGVGCRYRNHNEWFIYSNFDLFQPVINVTHFAEINEP